MKRSWLGFGLLLVLLILSLAATGLMTRIHQEIALDLAQSSECALLGEWEDTQLFLHRARRIWTKWEGLRACLSSHEPTEDIDAAFAALQIYCQSRNAAAYRAACAMLTCRVRAIGDAQRPVWQNLL